MTGASNSKIATLIEWLVLSFATIIKLIRDDKRTAEELNPLKDAIQAVIDREAFIVKLLHPKKSLKELLLSVDKEEIQAGWNKLYDRWGILYENYTGDLPPSELIPYKVPELPFGYYDRIALELNRGWVLIYLAPELSTTSDLSKLDELFPEMKFEVTLDGDKVKQIKNTNDNISGWLFVDMRLDIHNTNTTEENLRTSFIDQNTKGMTLNVYVIFGQFCKEIFGGFPDYGSRLWARLLGSFYNDSVLCAGFNRNGTLRVKKLSDQIIDDNHGDVIGERSVKIVKF